MGYIDRHKESMNNLFACRLIGRLCLLYDQRLMQFVSNLNYGEGDKFYETPSATVRRLLAYISAYKLMNEDEIEAVRVEAIGEYKAIVRGRASGK